LLLVNYRPEYQHQWGNKTYYTQLRLDPLGPAEAEEMLTTLLDEKMSPLPARERDRVRVIENNLQPLKQFILDKTEGNPFFMEEIVQELAEQGLVGAHGRVPLPTNIHIPPTVQAVLASRIDRLPPEEKELLQTLAVIGKEFSLGLLKQVVDQSEDTLQQRLFRLRDAEFIYEQPAFPEPDYVFKHALTQEVAYNSMLVERRKALHERAAQAIETLFQNRLDDQYSELASHYSRSGNTEKAVDYLQLAGQQAVQRSANVEAVTHLTAALDLLKTLPETPERTQQELLLQIALGLPLVFIKGYTASEVGKTYARARELCRQIGEPSQLFQILRGLLGFALNRGEAQTAHELGKQLLTLAKDQRNPLLLLEAHYSLALTLFPLGEMRLAYEHTERCESLYSPQHNSVAFYSLENPSVSCLRFASLILWCLGYPEQALQKSHQALTLARELSHSFSLAWDLVGAAWFHLLRREENMVRTYAEEAIRLSTEQGFPFWLAMGNIYEGWALAQQGQPQEGITQIHHGLAALRASGAEGWRPYFLALLAEAYRKEGQVENELTTLAEALTLVDKSGERFYEAELHRLKGELTLQLKVESQKSKVPSTQHPTPGAQAEAEAEAEACFLKALEVSRKQQAKSLELRAVTSLVRLRQQQASEQGAGSKELRAENRKQGARARLDEARTMLSGIYNWFTEGFDTKDLQEAKALIEELAESKPKRQGKRQKKN
jgi:predicted ATPase